MNYSTYDCIDAGTENCPCYLALTGDCLTCSRLQGKDTCDCNWKGVCIYNEFKQGNGRVNNPRKEFTASIVQRKFYLDDLAVFVLDVGKGFAIKAGSPGSYIFMRGQKDTRFYDIPISVMYADVEKGQIHVAIKVISTKTKTLLEEKEAFVLRGVYRNGIQGLEAIKPRNLKGARVLLVAKGIGLAPAILTAESLCHRNQVDLVVDTEKISTELVSDYLEGGLSAAENTRNRERKEAAGSIGAAGNNGTPGTMETAGAAKTPNAVEAHGAEEPAGTEGGAGAPGTAEPSGSPAAAEGVRCAVHEPDGRLHRIRYLSLGNTEDRETLRAMMEAEQYDSVAVLASDYFVEEIGKMAEEVLPNAQRAFSNNFRICCGEGICGACSVVNAGGETIKMCKCQLK